MPRPSPQSKIRHDISCARLSTPPDAFRSEQRIACRASSAGICLIHQQVRLCLHQQAFQTRPNTVRRTCTPTRQTIAFDRVSPKTLPSVAATNKIQQHGESSAISPTGTSAEKSIRPQAPHGAVFQPFSKASYFSVARPITPRADPTILDDRARMGSMASQKASVPFWRRGYGHTKKQAHQRRISPAT